MDIHIENKLIRANQLNWSLNTARLSNLMEFLNRFRQIVLFAWKKWIIERRSRNNNTQKKKKSLNACNVNLITV